MPRPMRLRFYYPMPDPPCDLLVCPNMHILELERMRRRDDERRSPWSKLERQLSVIEN
jgi:hypothetical protein